MGVLGGCGQSWRIELKRTTFLVTTTNREAVCSQF